MNEFGSSVSYLHKGSENEGSKGVQEKLEENRTSQGRHSGPEG